MLIEVRNLDKKSNPLNVSKGDTPPIQHTVEPNTRVEIYMDGQKQNGQSAAGAPTKKLTKVGKNLVLSEEDKPLVELVNFYGEAGVTLVGDNWSAADTQLTAVSEGLAFQEVAPQEVGALVAAGPSTLTWVLGGVAAVGLGGGGGGGGGGSTTTTSTSASSTTTAALAVIKDYSGSNTTPTISHYQAAGVTGVTNGNLSAINSAISPLVSGVTDTTAKVQAVVDAYKAVLASADGTGNNGTKPTQAQYANLGVKGVDTTEAERLLGDVIDIKSNGDVNNVSQVQDLADAVAAVLRGAKGDATVPVTLKQLTTLGITSVTDSNITAIQAVIKNTKDVNQVDSRSELQDIVQKMAISQPKIQKFAINTTLSADVPTSLDFSNIGVTGVTSDNLGAINSSIAFLSENDTSTFAQVQTVVDAYKAVLDNANAAKNINDANFIPPSVAQYAAIGISGFTTGVSTAEMKAKADLLGSVIDEKSNESVNTLDKLQALSSTVDKLMLQAADKPQDISQQELENLGITRLTSTNLKAMLSQIFATKNDGSEILTLKALQNWVDNEAPVFVPSPTAVIKDSRVILTVKSGTDSEVFRANAVDLNGVTYSISEDDGRNLQIDAITGSVKFKSPISFGDKKDSPGTDPLNPNDYNSFYFNVTATDTLGHHSDQFITLFVVPA